MTGTLPTIVTAIVTAARDVAADIEYASTEENLTPERASALKALSDNFYATAFQAEENDPDAARFVCDMLGLDKLLADYDAQCGQEQDTSHNP
ncbi:hypothetical protein [Paracoccus fontiphilus]|uniref:Uncharacterized protein n=1 Tax=Paracoccus fontiphilus TaxID=1815556 RepID=A0ABV7I8K1_9RHOB|nr:hypothetical protein [Paracoccus fontiphilus]